MLVNPHFLYSISSSTKLGFILKKIEQEIHFNVVCDDEPEGGGLHTARILQAN